MARRNRLVAARAKRLKQQVLENPRKTSPQGKPLKDWEKVQVKELARALTGKAILQLERMMTKSRSENTRLAAVELILAYGWGKPKQAVIGGDDGDNPIKHAHTVEHIVIDP